MEPSFSKIADLFALPKPPDPDSVEANPRKRRGDTADESRDLGRQSLTEGNFEDAVRHFRDAVAQRPEGDISAVIDLAGAYDYGDQYPQAYRQYLVALRQEEDSVEPLVGISDLMRRHGRFREGAAELERAIAREPANAYWHMKLAELLREMGERRKAHAAAQRAVLAKPDVSFYHYWIGDLLLEMGRYDEALESLRAAIELSPGDDFLYLRAAVGFWRADRKPEAIKALRLASDLDPSKHLYHGLLEELLREMGNDEEADLEIDRASKMDLYDEDLLDRTLAEMGVRN